MAKTIIVIPTYNEAGNIVSLLRQIFTYAPQVYVLIVDDNSPDGTASIVTELQETYQNLLILRREKKEGLGVAYRAGFSRAMELYPDTEILGMMDADFCHEPRDLPRLLEAAKRHDMVIGSVYAPGGDVPPSFTLARRVLSRGGNLYCRLFFGYPLTDWTNAYVVVKTSALQKINLALLPAREFAFVSGLKYLLLKSGATWKDIGTRSNDRTAGRSKITLRTIIEALLVPWGLRFGKALHEGE